MFYLATTYLCFEVLSCKQEKSKDKRVQPATLPCPPLQRPEWVVLQCVSLLSVSVQVCGGEGVLGSDILQCNNNTIV